MIELDDTDRKWIQMCKGHFSQDISKPYYPYTGTWVNTLKPLFEAQYGWNPNDDYYLYLQVVFDRLLNLFIKIMDDKSGVNLQLKSVFSASFYKSISLTEDLPIERAIASLCGLITGNSVIEEDGTKRYEMFE